MLYSGVQYRNIHVRFDQPWNEDASGIPLEAISWGSACRPAHQEVVWSILHPTSSSSHPQDAESSLTPPYGL